MAEASCRVCEPPLGVQVFIRFLGHMPNILGEHALDVGDNIAFRIGWDMSRIGRQSGLVLSLH